MTVKGNQNETKIRPEFGLSDQEPGIIILQPTNDYSLCVFMIRLF